MRGARQSRGSSWLLLGASSCALVTCAAWGQAKGGENSDFFEAKIRPLLAEKCFSCHGDAKQQSGLRLDTRIGLNKGSGAGPVIVAGKPNESGLIRAVRYNAAIKMPPTGKLSPAQIADLEEWVRTGAVWPEVRRGDEETRRQGDKENQSKISASSTPNASSTLLNYPADRRHFWSFQPVKNPPLPVVKNAAWVKNPIDRFVLARLEAKGLKPAPPADRRTLLRRATFDLTGLPPTPDEVDAFINDKSPNAWEKVVDRLLASPRYGERWGRHWLDVVRYADSYDSRGSGSEGDISEAWRYRDWVVNAFNQDMPYSDFMKNQIAGDLLPEKTDRETRGQGDKENQSSIRNHQPSTVNYQLSTINHQPPLNPSGIIATGLLAIGNWGNGDADKDKILTDIADDQVDVVSRSMMGLTVACARCHDHKFDPIPTKDYYGLAGIFFSSHILPKLTPKGAGEAPLRIPLETPADTARRTQYAQEVTAGEARLKQERSAQYAAYAKRLLPLTAKYVQATWQYAHRPEAQSGLSLEAYAGGKQLQPFALRQWRDYLGLGEYPLMTQAFAEVSGNKGVSAWRGLADCPNLLVNANDTARALGTLTLPPHSVSVHPGPNNGVVVAWRSPFTGIVRITGRVTDADPNCGNGIAWALDHRGVAGARELASGDFPNGGAQDCAQGKMASNLQAVQVKVGERIEMAVLPKGDYSCDTTILELTIAEIGAKENAAPAVVAGGAKANPLRVWNLTHDIVDDPLQGGKGNPHADRYGNAGIWSFEDMADRQRSGESLASPNPAVAQFRQALLTTGTTPAPAAVQQAAETFARSFTLVDDKSPFWIRNAADEALLPPPARDTLAKLTAQLDTLKKNPPPPVQFANGTQEGGVPESPHAGIHDVKVHIRGNYARLGDLVPRHFPIVLAGEHQAPITQGSGRLQLAEWLASPAHPLTPRVWVNRVWQHHFGQGLVRTPSNFGFLGERPTHPELLDWLASTFVQESGVRSQESGQAVPSTINRASTGSPEGQQPSTYACGWSTKKLHRLILLSATYQQASEARPETFKSDPDNRLWGRMNRLRLEAEAVRDSLLAASGRLDTTMGGIGYRDFVTPRRTLYYMTIRSDRSGFGPLFDAADSTASVDRRTISTVAPQSLYLLNNPFVIEQTRALAQRLAKEFPDGAGSDVARIRRAYVILYGRPAALEEISVGTAFLQRARVTTKEPLVWEQYCQILLCANEFVYVD